MAPAKIGFDLAKKDKLKAKIHIQRELKVVINREKKKFKTTGEATAEITFKRSITFLCVHMYIHQTKSENLPYQLAAILNQKKLKLLKLR